MQIFHIATRDDWEAAQRSGFYTTSTIGVTLQDEGFIHTSRADQVAGVYARYYAAVTDPLVLLIIDTDLLTAPWREDEVGSDTYPHIYGPLNPGAVVGTVPVSGVTPLATLETPTPAAQPSGSVPPKGDFTQAFLREVLTRVALAFGVMAVIAVCVVVAQAVNDEYAWIGALVGLTISFVAARAIYRRLPQNG